MRVPVGILLLLIVSLGHAEQDLTARGEVLALLESVGVQEEQWAVQDRNAFVLIDLAPRGYGVDRR